MIQWLLKTSPEWFNVKYIFNSHLLPPMAYVIDTVLSRFFQKVIFSILSTTVNISVCIWAKNFCLSTSVIIWIIGRQR